jgi:3-oxoacyl-[acyl-carrier-protein] synthase II
MIICDMCAGIIAIELGALGPNYTTVSACASAAHAIGEAARKIQYDEADVMVTGGAEASVTALSIAGFAASRALAQRNDSPEEASRPFDADRDDFLQNSSDSGSPPTPTTSPICHPELKAP